MPKSDVKEVVDGRRLRSERSRSAIINAMVALQDDGILVPTAHQGQSKKAATKIITKLLKELLLDGKG